MRIDLTSTLIPELKGGGQTTPTARAGQALAAEVPGSGEDVVQLSTSSDVVNRLHDYLAGVPDVRQARVNELRQAVSDGSFAISAERIADAMLSR